MKNILRYILTLSSLLFCALGYSGSYTLRGLSLSDGLSDLVVNAIYKDSLGFVWIGTGNSLERFDGVHIKNYQIAGTNEKLKRVNAITEMSGNELWVGNGMGLWRLNKEKLVLEQMVPETIRCAVYTLWHDGNGTLYIGSEKGLFIYKAGNMEQLLFEQNVFAAANAVTGIVAGQRGELWISTREGLYSVRLSDKQITAHHHATAGKHICSFNNLSRIGPMLYMGTMDQGIISFDTRTAKFDSFVDVGCNVISSLSGNGKNTLYVGTDGNGVHFIDTERKAVVRSMRHEAGNDESLRSNSVYSLLVDRDGVVWIGFYQFGLDYTLYQNDLFATYAFPPFLNTKDMPVRAIAIGRNEKLIGSRDGLFYIDERNGRFKSFKSPQMRSSMIFCILYFEDEYYVGTYGGGMYVFDPKTLTLRDFVSDPQSPFINGHIFCIKKGAGNQLWIGTSQGVYCYENGKELMHYTSANSKLPEGNVYEIYFDSTHKGWICTENGLCIWDPSSQKLRTDVFPEGFIHKEKVRVVYEDSKHTLYFFPDKGAMFMSDLSMNRFRMLQPGTPMEGRDGMFIIEGNDNWLWLGSSNGLFYYDKSDHFIPYNFVDGIPNSIFTLCPPVRDSEGNFWFGNSKGLLYLDVSRMNKGVRDFYPVRVTDIFINGQPSIYSLSQAGSERGELRLESTQKNVTFSFSDFSYTSPAFMAYEYKLEGRDDNWIAITGTSEVTYYDLSSGVYRFKVRRMGQPESEAVLSVAIASTLAVWVIPGAFIGLFLAGLLLYFGKFRNKIRPKATSAEALVRVLEEKPEPEVKLLSEEKYKTIKVSIDECKRLSQRLHAIMQADKPYISPDLKIADLAAAIGTSAHTLSYLFNQHLERNYYDYINDYRIAEFKRLLNKDEYAKYTLSALAELCGFSSRASFFRSFKKATGITPNEYVRSIGKNNE